MTKKASPASVRRGRTFSKVPRPIASNVARVRTVLNPVNIALGIAGIQSYGIIITELGFTQRFASYQAIYDEYRFVRMKVHFRPVYNEAYFVAASSTGSSANFAGCIDVDDAVTPSSYADLLNHSTVKFGPSFKAYDFDFAPCALLAVDNNTTTPVGSAPKPLQWLDTAQSTVNHYGVKWTLDPAPSGYASTTTIMVVWTEVEVEYRHQT